MSKKALFIIITFIAVLLVIAAASVSAFIIRDKIINNLVDQYAQQEQTIAKDTAKILEAEISSVAEKLTIISQIPQVQKGETEVCNSKLKEILNSMEDRVRNLGRMDKDGIFNCSVTESTIGVDGTQYEHLAEIINTHQPVLGRVILPAQEGGDLVTSLHVPIFDENGNFIGTLGGAIYFNDLKEKYLKDISFAQQGYVVLQDDNGDILFHPKVDFVGKNIWGEEMQKAINESEEINAMTRAVASGKSGTQRYVFEGKEKIAAYAPANIFNDRIWPVVVTVPIEDVNSALSGVGINELFVSLIFTMIAIITIIAAFVIIYMIKTVFNPINDLTEIIEKISRGDMKVELEPGNGKDEISRLKQAFHRVLASLKIAMMKSSSSHQDLKHPDAKEDISSTENSS